MAILIHPRRGIAMVLVMVVLAAATILGLTYVETSVVRNVGLANLTTATRAKYLAESGLQHGMYKLQTDLPAVSNSSQGAPLGPFYVDGTQDRYVFYGEPVAGELGHYILRAEGTCGTVTQKCAMKVWLAPAPQAVVPHGLMVANSMTTPTSLTITGSVYAQGNYWNYSHVVGNVYCSGWVWDTLLWILGTVSKMVPLQTAPTLSGGDYTQYKLYGIPYSWAQVNDVSEINASHPLANGGAVTPGNPGGVVKLWPHETYVKLKDNLDFQGTLVITGDIVLDGKNVKLTAVPGFPAIVATGKVILRNDKSMVVNGLVIADGGICPSNDSDVSATTINGGVLAKAVGYSQVLKGSHVLKQVADRCTIYDFSADAQMPKIEVLRWDD